MQNCAGMQALSSVWCSALVLQTDAHAFRDMYPFTPLCWSHAHGCCAAHWARTCSLAVLVSSNGIGTQAAHLLLLFVATEGPVVMCFCVCVCCWPSGCVYRADLERLESMEEIQEFELEHVREEQRLAHVVSRIKRQCLSRTLNMARSAPITVSSNTSSCTSYGACFQLCST